MCLYLPDSANLVAVIVVQFVISQDKISYEFFVGDHRIDKSLKETLEQLKDEKYSTSHRPGLRFKQ